MEGLNFYLLGPPYVTYNDSMMDIPRRQVRMLLYYLATYPNAIPRERLHYLFWSDEPEAVCRRNLSHLLTHARRALPDINILIVKNSLIMLDPELIWCDVIEFKKLLISSNQKNQRLAFQQANSLYRGPYLEGKDLPGGREFEFLIERERNNLERSYLNLVYKLILIEKQQGNFERAVELAYQYLAIDELSEEVHRQLITLHHLTGVRERALAQYKMCEELLWKELQAKPSQKTVDIYQQVLSENISETKNETHGWVKPEIRQVRLDPTYIRKSNLDELRSILKKGDNGLWGIILLVGELGIGKTSLITKYLENTGKEKWVLRTKCNPGSHSIRYWPIQQICLAASKTFDHMVNEELDTFDQIKNCMFRFFDNYTLPSDIPGFLDSRGKDSCFSLFTRIVLDLAELCDGLILCFEDLEWADEDTLDLIVYLSSHLREKKVLIFGSLCCEENQILKKFISKVRIANDFLGSFKVQGLDLEKTHTIVKFWLGDFDDSNSLAVKLQRVTGGNPFFLSEILRWILEAEVPVAKLLQADAMGLPTSIMNVVNFRLHRLGEGEIKVLETASIIGYSFNLEQVFELCELPKIQIIDALDELVNRHLLENHSSGYQFRHDLIYQSVLENIHPARKQLFEHGMALPSFRSSPPFPKTGK